MAFSSSLPSKPQVTDKSLQDHFLISTLPRKGGSSTLSRLFSFIKRSKEIPVPPVQKKKKMKSWNLVSSERRRNKDKDASSSALPLFGCCTSTSHDAFNPEFKSGPLLLPDSNPSPVLVSSSGRYANDVPLNLGIGFGLIYLTLACKNELNKMVEQKTRMEALIKDAKTVITTKDDGISNLSQSNDDLSFSVSRLPMVGSTSYMSNANSVALYSSLGETDNGQERDEYFEIGFNHEREEGAAGVDHLEAELETELERLQLNLDAEESFRDELQQKQEMEAKHIVPIKSETDTSTEEENTREFTYVEYGGVSPKELERRLHELLEERQRKRIRELECALEHTKKKLLEKEMEVTWWKDTARLISLHASEANSSLSR